MKQTAVEFLWDMLLKGEFINDPEELLTQAKEMEKEQIMNAWRNGDNDSMYPPQELDRQAEEYYNETYGKE